MIKRRKMMISRTTMILLAVAGGTIFGLGFIFLNYQSNIEYQDDDDFTAWQSARRKKDFESNSISEVFAASTSNLSLNDVRLHTYTISLFTVMA